MRCIVCKRYYGKSKESVEAQETKEKGQKGQDQTKHGNHNDNKNNNNNNNNNDDDNRDYDPILGYMCINGHSQCRVCSVSLRGQCAGCLPQGNQVSLIITESENFVWDGLPESVDYLTCITGVTDGGVGAPKAKTGSSGAADIRDKRKSGENHSSKHSLVSVIHLSQDDAQEDESLPKKVTKAEKAERATLRQLPKEYVAAEGADLERTALEDIEKKSLGSEDSAESQEFQECQVIPTNQTFSIACILQEHENLQLSQAPQDQLESRDSKVYHECQSSQDLQDSEVTNAPPESKTIVLCESHDLDCPKEVSLQKDSPDSKELSFEVNENAAAVVAAVAAAPAPAESQKSNKHSRKAMYQPNSYQIPDSEVFDIYSPFWCQPRWRPKPKKTLSKFQTTPKRAKKVKAQEGSTSVSSIFVGSVQSSTSQVPKADQIIIKTSIRSASNDMTIYEQETTTVEEWNEVKPKKVIARKSNLKMTQKPSLKAPSKMRLKTTLRVTQKTSQKVTPKTLQKDLPKMAPSSNLKTIQIAKQKTPLESLKTPLKTPLKAIRRSIKRLNRKLKRSRNPPKVNGSGIASNRKPVHIQADPIQNCPANASEATQAEGANLPNATLPLPTQSNQGFGCGVYEYSDAHFNAQIESQSESDTLKGSTTDTKGPELIRNYGSMGDDIGDNDRLVRNSIISPIPQRKYGKFLRMIKRQQPQSNENEQGQTPERAQERKQKRIVKRKVKKIPKEKALEQADKPQEQLTHILQQVGDQHPLDQQRLETLRNADNLYHQYEGLRKAQQAQPQGFDLYADSLLIPTKTTTTKAGTTIQEFPNNNCSDINSWSSSFYNDCRNTTTEAMLHQVVPKN